jgi:hypothetical protein
MYWSTIINRNLLYYQLVNKLNIKRKKYYLISIIFEYTIHQFDINQFDSSPGEQIIE